MFESPFSISWKSFQSPFSISLSDVWLLVLSIVLQVFILLRPVRIAFARYQSLSHFHSTLHNIMCFILSWSLVKMWFYIVGWESKNKLLTLNLPTTNYLHEQNCFFSLLSLSPDRYFGKLAKNAKILIGRFPKQIKLIG